MAWWRTGVERVPVWEGLGPAWKIWTLAAIVGSVVLGLYGFVRLGTFRQRVDPTAPTLSRAPGKEGAGGGGYGQRQEALLRDGNLWEAARDLARQLLVSAGVRRTRCRPSPSAAAGGGAGGPAAMAAAVAAGARQPPAARFAAWLRPPGGPGRGVQAALADGTVRIIP